MRNAEGPKLRWKRGTIRVRFRKDGVRREISLGKVTEEEALQRVREMFDGDVSPAASKVGFVYFVEAMGAYRVKIGWTTDLKRRLEDFRVAIPEQLQVLAVVPNCTQADERRLHHLFADVRLNREWFFPSKSLRAAASRFAAGSTIQEVFGGHL